MEILIIRPAALGDTLMLLPALDRINHSASVVLVGRKPSIDYLRPFARICLDFEGNGWHTLFTDRPELANLPEVDIAPVFLNDVDGKVKKNLESLLPGARVHVFPGLPGKKEEIHAALHLARCLRTAGCEIVNPEECVEQAISRPLLQDKRGPQKGNRIIFHPGSGGREKNHPPEFWLSLIRNLSAPAFFRGLLPTLLLGPAEEGLRSFFEHRLQMDWNGAIFFSPDPEDLMSLLKEGALYIGQDSGVTHLAAMTGLPTIALFRSSSIKTWRPLGPRVRVLRDEMDERIDNSAVVKEAESFLRCV
jgi:ADP-heptose:LPS heptosyltransferase